MYNISNIVKIGNVVMNLTPQGERREEVKNNLNELEESLNATWKWSWTGAATGAILGGVAGYFGCGGTAAAAATAEALGLASCACAPALIAGAAGVILFLIVGGLIGGKLAQLLSALVKKLKSLQVSFEKLFQENSSVGFKASFN